MKKASNSSENILPHYDFEPGVQGKYAKRYGKGTNVVILDPDVAKIFGNGRIVNQSLRKFAKTLAK